MGGEGWSMEVSRAAAARPRRPAPPAEGTVQQRRRQGVKHRERAPSTRADSRVARVLAVLDGLSAEVQAAGAALPLLRVGRGRRQAVHLDALACSSWAAERSGAEQRASLRPPLAAAAWCSTAPRSGPLKCSQDPPSNLVSIRNCSGTASFAASSPSACTLSLMGCRGRREAAPNAAREWVREDAGMECGTHKKQQASSTKAAHAARTHVAHAAERGLAGEARQRRLRAHRLAERHLLQRRGGRGREAVSRAGGRWAGRAEGHCSQA